MVTLARQAAETLIGTMGSIGQALDVWQLLYGEKPAARVVLPEEALFQVKTLLVDLELVFETADFRLNLLPNPYGYADNAEKTQDTGTRSILYVAKDKNQALVCKNTETKDDHHHLGVLLGYPSCCSLAFAKWCLQTADRDFTLKGIPSEPAILPWQNNCALRHFDTRLSPHFPCSAFCKNSSEVNTVYFTALHAYLPELAFIFKKRLSSTIVYHRKEGPFILVNAKITDGEWAFDDVEGNRQSLFCKRLVQEKRIIPSQDVVVLRYQ